MYSEVKITDGAPNDEKETKKDFKLKWVALVVVIAVCALLFYAGYHAEIFARDEDGNSTNVYFIRYTKYIYNIFDYSSESGEESQEEDESNNNNNTALAISNITSVDSYSANRDDTIAADVFYLKGDGGSPDKSDDDSSYESDEYSSSAENAVQKTNKNSTLEIAA